MREAIAGILSRLPGSMEKMVQEHLVAWIADFEEDAFLDDRIWPPIPHKFNAHRRDKFPSTKFRVTNWPEYNEALRRRGSGKSFPGAGILDRVPEKVEQTQVPPQGARVTKACLMKYISSGAQYFPSR